MTQGCPRILKSETVKRLRTIAYNSTPKELERAGAISCCVETVPIIQCILGNETCCSSSYHHSQNLQIARNSMTNWVSTLDDRLQPMAVVTK